MKQMKYRNGRLIKLKYDTLEDYFKYIIYHRSVCFTVAPVR